MPRQGVLSYSRSSGSQAGVPPALTLRRQVKADVSIIVHGAVELAVTGFTEVERSSMVQLLAVGVVAHLHREGGGGGLGCTTGRLPCAPHSAQVQVLALMGAALHSPTIHSPQGTWCSLSLQMAPKLLLCIQPGGHRENQSPAREEWSAQGRPPVGNHKLSAIRASSWGAGRKGPPKYSWLNQKPLPPPKPSPSAL